MAKKKPTAEFNMSETIRELLTENPNLTARETTEAILEKHPTAKINKNSFSVAFYTGRKKLGIGSSRRGRKVGVRKLMSGTRPTVDLAKLQTAVRFIRDVGGAEAALEAIKQVQAIQVK
jgi:hypothetical protein